MKNLQDQISTYKTLTDLSPTATYLCIGESMTISVANIAALNSWRQNEGIIGRPITEALPGSAGLYFKEILLEVYQSGNTKYLNERKADFTEDSGQPDAYFNLSFKPFKNSEGETLGVVCFSIDVTEFVLSAQNLTDLKETTRVNALADSKFAETQKNEFITLASHELKTPLTTIRSYVQILLAKAKVEDDEVRVDALKRVEKQANKMSALIQNFLDNAKLLTGKFELHIEPFDIREVLVDVLNDVRLRSPGHQFILKDCEKLLVLADRYKIEQVLENLISNAVKYSSVGSTITIACNDTGNHYQISIHDTGVGIAKKDQIRLFERFYRVNDSKIKNVAGFGIGLFLVSEILKIHGSQIFVISETGKGSKFYFDLPKANFTTPKGFL